MGTDVSTPTAPSVLTFDTPGTIWFLISVLLPLLVALATKSSTSPAIKASLLLGLSALNTVLLDAYRAAEQHIHWDWKPVVAGTIVAFVSAVATQFGFHRPIGLSGAAAKIINADPVKVVDQPMHEPWAAATPPEVAQAPQTETIQQSYILTPETPQAEQYYADLYARQGKEMTNLMPPPPEGTIPAPFPPPYAAPAEDLFHPAPSVTSVTGSIVLDDEHTINETQDDALTGEINIPSDAPTPLAEETQAVLDEPKPKRKYVRKAPLPVKKAPAKKVAAKAPAKKVAAKKAPAKKAAPIKR